MVAPPLYPPGEYHKLDQKKSASSDPTDMPKALSDELADLENWAKTNSEAADNDSKKYWYLKGPAIAASSIGVIFSYHQQTDWAMYLGALGGVLVLLDGIVRPGIMRNARYLAFYESRELQASIAAKWKAAILKSPGSGNELASELIDELSKERARISTALKLVEVNQATS